MITIKQGETFCIYSINPEYKLLKVTSLTTRRTIYFDVEGSVAQYGAYVVNLDLDKGLYEYHLGNEQGLLRVEGNGFTANDNINNSWNI